MRIDAFLCVKGFFASRNKAKESIERGEIYFNGERIEKPSFDIKEGDDDKIKIVRKASEFVSIGGFKLEKALNDFGFSVDGMVAADVGASTGGFTDCLIQRGARKIFAVDLNDGLLSAKIRNNPIVIPVIRNARYLEKNDFDSPLDLIVADLSFISETLVLPIFSEILQSGKRAIILIKPQFEGDRKEKRKNGIIIDDKDVFAAIKKVVVCSIENGFTPEKLTAAPIVSGKNKEYLLLMVKKSVVDFNVDCFINKNLFGE